MRSKAILSSEMACLPPHQPHARTESELNGSLGVVQQLDATFESLQAIHLRDFPALRPICPYDYDDIRPVYGHI